jgi:hypothetical protein
MATCRINRQIPQHVGILVDDTSATSTAEWTSASSGGDLPHENRPPFRAIYFIKKK